MKFLIVLALLFSVDTHARIASADTFCYDCVNDVDSYVPIHNLESRSTSKETEVFVVMLSKDKRNKEIVDLEKDRLGLESKQTYITWPMAANKLGKRLIYRWNKFKENIEARVVYQHTARDTNHHLPRMQSIEENMPHDFYGFTIGKKVNGKTQAIIGINAFQGIMDGTMTLFHELFHLFDPYLKNPKGENFDIDFIAEFRAYLAEVRAHKDIRISYMMNPHVGRSWAMSNIDHKNYRSTNNLYDQMSRIKSEDNKLFTVFNYTLERYMKPASKGSFRIKKERPIKRYTHVDQGDFSEPSDLVKEVGHSLRSVWKSLLDNKDSNKDQVYSLVYERLEEEQDIKPLLVKMNKFLRKISPEIHVTEGLWLVDLVRYKKKIIQWIKKHDYDDISELTDKPNLLLRGGPKGRNHGD